jgi:uncharacterized phage protein gp47/JayE
MATLAAQISSAGISSPSYADILAELQYLFWSIYGSDANLDADTQDGQFLAVLAQAVYDNNQLAIAIYNAFSPATAQGAGLSSLVKINGLVRRSPSNSSAVVTIVGQVGTIITNGIVGDNLGLGTKWALPETVIIPVGGAIDATATCTVAGDYNAAAGSLTEILTPTRGWQSVTNATDAIPGLPVETDTQLRQRQAVSTSLPALTTLETIYAAIANLSGVGRLQVYQNDGDVADADGIPAHSISAVIEGGNVDQIAAAIASKKSPGTGTFGSTTQIVFDANGVPDTIRFYELDLVTITVEIDITPLPGYVSTTGDALVAAVADFINGLAIGEHSYLARLYSPANTGGVGLGTTYVVTAIRQSRTGPPTAADVVIAFNEAAVCDAGDITLNVT